MEDGEIEPFAELDEAIRFIEIGVIDWISRKDITDFSELKRIIGEFCLRQRNFTPFNAF